MSYPLVTPPGAGLQAQVPRMPALAPTQASSLTNPALVFYAVDQHGHLANDLVSLQFQIFRMNDDASRLSPVQVYPTTPGNKATVDMTPTGPDYLGVGRYVADYTVATSEPVGLHEIRWFWQDDEVGAPLRMVRKQFEVVTSGPGALGLGPTLCFLADIRDEGFASTGPGSISDARLQMTIVLATRFVESFTARSFGARYELHRFSGKGGRIMQFNEPIIAAELVSIDTTPYSQADLIVDPDLYRVFNRHIGGLVSPDDRENPKIEFVHSDDLLGVGIYRTISINLRTLMWPDGVQNCAIWGLWGYTEADGSPWGEVPALVRQVTKLMVLREMVQMKDVDCRDEWRRRWQLTGERTRDQSNSLAQPRMWGSMTGDPEIDSILTLYRRGPIFGSV